MVIIKQTGTLDRETFTPESGDKSLERIERERQQRVLEQHVLGLVDLHSGQMEPESFDAAVMYAHDARVWELGEAATDSLEDISLMTSGALMDVRQAERLFRSAETDDDDVLRVVWADALAIRQHATSAEEERHALDTVFESTVVRSKEEPRSVRRISSLAIGMLSQYPDLAAKYTGHLIDTE